MKILLPLIIFFTLTTQSQGIEKDKTYFSTALSMHLKEYNERADRAYFYKDYKEGERLFKEFTSDFLEGTYMDNFKVRNLKKKPVHLYEFKKPMLLITYASWCIPGKGEIPALNQLADEYAKKVDIVVLFWDSHSKVKELAKQFNPKIKITFVDESTNEQDFVIRKLKHSLGLPTCFLISGDKKIMAIQRSVFPSFQTDEEIAYRKNFEAIDNSISKNLLLNFESEYADNLLGN
ncbi:TlpA disulfide reductase family protein [Gramella sp. AN32]|uniref:TlpA family protein disulfide reductase n=1 Tax=Christiangramia antarctica TaxID=2058158 RepID=A0ABW5X8M6_9FLAO|nr:TlpA disulfide reductase family protein [Gramella sp. AN32]MCM4156517.1 thioredoxin [Gramella sp. AN32]